MPSPTNGLPDRGSRRHVPILDEIDEGALAGQLAVFDNLDAEDPRVVAHLVDHLVAKLEEPQRSSVQMVALRGMTYEEAADLLHAELGHRYHRTQVWRWTKYGLRQVRDWLEDTPWVAVLMVGRIPIEGGDVEPPGTTGPLAFHDALTAEREPQE